MAETMRFFMALNLFLVAIKIGTIFLVTLTFFILTLSPFRAHHRTG